MTHQHRRSGGNGGATSQDSAVEVDRIADIWGQRTLHQRGTVWPARVDTHLAGGVDPGGVDR